MNTEKNNQQIQDKFDSRQFEFNKANWDKMIPELDKLEKKKKRRAFFYFVLPGLIGLGFLFLFLQYNTNEVSKVVHTPEKHPASNDLKKNKGLNGNNNTGDKTGIEMNAEPKETLSLNYKPESSAASEAEHLNTSGGNKNTTEISSHFHKNGNVQLTITQNPKNSLAGKPKGKNTMPETATEEKNEMETHTANPGVEKPHVKDSLASIDHAILQEPVVSSLQKTDSLLHMDRFDSVIVQKNDSLPAARKDSLVKGKDSLNKKLPSLEIFSSAYLAFTPGYEGIISIKECLNPSAGLGIKKFFHPKFGIGSGVYYSIYGNISSSPKLFKSTTQDFGYTNSITEIKQTRLHYIKIPMTFEFRSNKNYFSLGAEFLYLITSSSEVKNYDEAFGVNTETKTQKVYGYTSGFSNYDLNAVLIYSRRLSKRISFSALINSGFIDIKNNSYFNSANFDRNTSLQIGINYKLN